MKNRGERRRLRWYIKMLTVFARMSLQSQLEYRLNFLAFTSVELGYMIIKLLYLAVVVNAGVNIGPLTPDMVMIFVGTYIFMTGVWMLLSGVNDIPLKVFYGEMDMLLTKPGSLQFLQTFGRFNFGLAFPNMTAGIVLMIVGWVRAGIPVNFLQVTGFIFYLCMGMLMTYSFILIPTLFIFWTASLGGLGNIISATWDFNNMPMLMYNKVIRAIGTYVLPVFLLTNWAGMFILHQLSVFEAIWGIIVPVGLLILSRHLWKRAFRRYQSAGG